MGVHSLCVRKLLKKEVRQGHSVLAALMLYFSLVLKESHHFLIVC